MYLSYTGEKTKMTPVRYVYCLHSGLYDTATRHQASGSAVAEKPRDAPRQLKKYEISFRLQNRIQQQSVNLND